jgi:hypothetical protein
MHYFISYKISKINNGNQETKKNEACMVGLTTESNGNTRYSVFHLFRQDKFAYGGSILSSTHLFTSPPAGSKNGAR